MVKVNVNFADAEDFEAVPEDTYDAVIEKIEYREPKEAGKYPYLNVEYTIADGEFEGRKIWEVLSWSPKALFRMRDFFEAFGIEGEDHDLEVDEDSNLLINPALDGVAVEIVVENEIQNKKERNRVVSVEPTGEVPDFDTAADDDDEDEDDEDDEDTSDESEDDEDDEDEDDDEEEEEEEPAPKKKAVKKEKAAPSKKAAPAKGKASKVKKPVGKKRVLK